MTITTREVLSWNPEKNPKPSIALVQALYLEYRNDYLTAIVWGEAHHMDEASAKRFLAHARAMQDAYAASLWAIKSATNPHA